MEIKHASYILNVVLIALLVIGATFSINKMSEVSSDFDSVKNFMEQEKDQLIQTNGLMVQEIKTINQNLVSSDERIKELSKELSEYKEISSFTKAELLSEIKDITIEFEPDGTLVIPHYVPDTNCVPIDSVNKYYIQTPKKVRFSDQWVTFGATVNKNSLTLDSLSMINKFDITIGERVTGKKLLVFNKKEPVVDLKSYNPYTKVASLNNITVETKKAKPITKVLTAAGLIGIGFVAGKTAK